MLPQEFSEVEHLQNLIRRYINKEIREHFRDIGDDNWEPDVSTTRGAMRHALTHKDDDPIQITLLRLFLYYFTYGQASALQMPVYGMPSQSFQEISFEFKPQIQLYFDQNIIDVQEGNHRATGEISYRLMHETSESITKEELRKRAEKIKDLFVTNHFAWHKGKIICRYTDKPNGYDLRVFVRNEAEGKRLIEQVLDIESKSPNWDNLTVSEPKKDFPSIPPTKTILGKSYKMPRRRPTETIYFRYAACLIWGLSKPNVLVDTRGTRHNPLVTLI